MAQPRFSSRKIHICEGKHASIQMQQEWSPGSGWRRPGIIRSALRRLTGIGKTSEVMSAEKIFLAYIHGPPPRGSSPGPPIPPSPKSCPSFHFYCPPPPPTFFFSTNHTSLWETRPENLPSMEEQQWGRGGGQVSGRLFRERSQAKGGKEDIDVSTDVFFMDLVIPLGQKQIT